MKSNKKTYLFIGLFLIFLGLSFGIFKYNKPHLNIAKSKTTVHINDTSLVEAFHANETLANAKYLDQIIEVKGRISEITKNHSSPIISLGKGDLFGNVVCHLSPQEILKVNQLEIGKTIIIKGICTGFLMDVTISNAIIQ